MLLHFLYFSQCVVCMFGHKTIYGVTNLKVHSKGRYFVKKKKSLFKNYNEQLVWTTKLFSCIGDITNFKSHLRKLQWLVGGETLDSALQVSKWKPSACFFISLYFWWKPTVFISFCTMSEKAEFLSGALFCVQCYRGNLELLPLVDN